MLEACTSKPAQIPVDGVQQRLGQTLAAWAEPLIAKGLVGPLAPDQLYAVVLAPMMTATTSAAEPEAGGAVSHVDWLEILTMVALVGIKLPGQKPKKKAQAGGGAPIKQQKAPPLSPPKVQGDLLLSEPDR